MRPAKAAKLSCVVIPVISLLILAIVVSIPAVETRASGITKPDVGTSAVFNSTIQLDEGKLKISYSSTATRLQLKCSLQEGDKEYQLSVESGEMLGVLIVVDGQDISYSVEFLKSDEDWAPLTDRPDKDSYKRRARFHQKPGWEILVLEKTEQRSV